MELLEACARIGELNPHLIDAGVLRSIETLAARAPGVEPIPDSHDAEELLYAVTDEVIRIGQDFERLGRVDDLILTRRIVADLLRPVRERNLLDFANALGMLSSLLAERGRHAEAVDVLGECADVLRPHLVLGVRHRGMYAHAVRDRGTSLVELGRVEEAVTAHREALRHYQRCAAEDASYALDVALTCHTHSVLLDQAGHPDLLEIAELGVSWARAVLADGGECRFQLAMMLRYRASALLRLDRPEEAVENGLEAAAVLREIAGHPVNDIQLALILHLVSDPLSALDRDDEALGTAAEAVGIVERPDPEPALRALMLWTYGRRLLEHGRLMEAKDAYLAAVPGGEDFREGLAPELYRLAEILVGEGLLSEASSILTVTARQYKLLAAADSDWAVPHAELLGRLAELEFHRGHHEAALRHAERAVAVARNSGDRETIARAMGHLGSSLAGAGRHDDAERAARDALELWPGRLPAHPRGRLEQPRQQAPAAGAARGGRGGRAEGGRPVRAGRRAAAPGQRAQQPGRAPRLARAARAGTRRRRPGRDHLRSAGPRRAQISA
ncbi:tetratricopeptide repeat protein [Microbispora sp. NEAU-D428]|uniref:tetratricopeptide repeat protein n=1 Tax=Microbispora sitophila TaxID=2771537 RepID=UPI0018665DA0|nr:tetratricopeptide repeat protein [Microbispora sitophila]MBE3011918.1 tetratricopeptide repeat protein [Microbispora sitophila]